MKRVIKKVLQTIDPFHFYNLGYKIYTAILKNRMQKTLDTMIGESAAIKNGII